MIEWFARNSVAANLLMFGIVIAGLYSASTAIPVETFPSREADTVTITTQFRGSTPKTAEDGITLRIEEAIADIEGILEITSRSTEGQSTVVAEVIDGYDKRDVLDDIKVRVDALNTLPSAAEKPTVSLNIRNWPVIYVAIMGEVGNRTLRDVATQFREGLLARGYITDAGLRGVANYQMNIEVSPQTLDDYNLTLEQIGQAIRGGASDISAGNVRTRDGDILVRSDGQAYSAEEFAKIPVLSNLQGKPITLGEIADIDDGFEEKSLLTSFNGVPAVMVQVSRVGDQSAIKVSQQTRDYINEFRASLPSGISIDYWDDDAEYLKTRIDAVLDSALFGGILVMVLLSLFLRPAVAFWVFLGIPVSFMGAFLFMPHVDGTFNVVSLFAFIMVIGIVVDDAIVTGENIYRKIRQGIQPLEASIVGTKEITTPVVFGILTTVVAFLPLHFLGGTRFAFIGAQMPMVVIPVLLMSLVESKLVLPSHMSHVKLRDSSQPISWLGRRQMAISHGLEDFVAKRYLPFLKKCIDNSSITLALIAGISIIIAVALYYGHIGFRSAPHVEASSVRVTLVMPESTGFETTHKYVERILDGFEQLQEKYTDPKTGQSVITDILATSGSSGRTQKSNLGQVRAELIDAGERPVDVTASQIGREIRSIVGDIPGAQSLSVRAVVFRSDAPVNIELSGAQPETMYEVAGLLKQKLKSFPGISDIQDNFSGGKEELKLSLKPRAYALGLRLEDVATQVRHAVFGFQAQRIQRGREELRVMVRYPLEARSSIEDLNSLAIRVPNSSEEVLLSEVAVVTPFESPSTLYRLDRKSVINVTADLDADATDPVLIDLEMDKYLSKLQQSYPDFDYRFDGEANDAAETNSVVGLGLMLVLVAIFILLAIPLRSYGQPFVVMSVIPFGLIGAVAGHVITFQEMSPLSVFGMLALVGVMVNDSLVLVDYTNKRRARGQTPVEAVLNAASTRFRPVLLTSITTFAGLAPILLDGSQQAKWLKPMATSLGFGILFATVITLVIVPINYLLGRRLKHATNHAASRLWAQWLAFWNKQDPVQR